MSNFPHSKRSAGVSRPDLPSLVAMAVAQQALSATALAVALDRHGMRSTVLKSHSDPSFFSAPRSRQMRFASFHPVIATQLLTEVQ